MMEANTICSDELLVQVFVCFIWKENLRFLSQLHIFFIHCFGYYCLCFIALKWHHCQRDSYKRKHLISDVHIVFRVNSSSSWWEADSYGIGAVAEIFTFWYTGSWQRETSATLVFWNIKTHPHDTDPLQGHTCTNKAIPTNSSQTIPLMGHSIGDSPFRYMNL